MDIEEETNVLQVLRSRTLSRFLGEWGSDFNGGKFVQEFEKYSASYFNVKHTISVNSWTSGLITAVGSLNIDPGDEIIVSPWTMSATATSILHFNAIPIFADIEQDTYCLDPLAVEAVITEKTRAIMSVDIFGQSANIEALMQIAKKHNLKVISDTAQSPGALRNDKYAGTLSDIGGFSFNYHKHVHSGEGGLIVTNDDELAYRSRLIRNHAEAVVQEANVTNLANMVGFNFRMTEIEAAISLAQLPKLAVIIKKRREGAEYLIRHLQELPGLKMPKVSEFNTHVYYIFAMQIEVSKSKLNKFELVQELTAAGIPNLSTKYQNVHLLPMFQKKIAFGSKGFPWNSEFARKDINYQKGICPVAEELQDNLYFGFYINEFDLTKEDLDFIIAKFKEVWRIKNRIF